VIAASAHLKHCKGFCLDNITNPPFEGWPIINIIFNAYSSSLNFHLSTATG
jgi:hypothetical protein